MNLKKYLEGRTLFVCLLIMLLAAACTTSTSGESSATDATDNMEEMEHDEDADHDDDHDHEESEEHEHERVPNNGAAVRILFPADGAVFQVGDEIPVEVELENFELSEGNHWHIFIDGSSWGMVMGGNTDEVVRGLEAGDHELSVFLSNEDHEELEDGDAIMIVVEE